MSDTVERARMAAFMPAAWRRRVAACGGQVHDADGLAVCLTGVPLAPFNPTLIERLPDDPDAAIERAEAHYEGTGLTLGIDLEPSLHGPVREAAERRGLTMEESRPGMTVAIADVVPAPPPDGVELFRVESPALLDQVVRVDESAFGVERPSHDGSCPMRSSRTRPSACTRPGVDGRLVSVGESTTLDGVVGVFGVATDPSYRRRGIGAVLTALLLADRAGEADFAALDASDPRRGVYARPGFAGMSTWEVWSASPAGLGGAVMIARPASGWSA